MINRFELFATTITQIYKNLQRIKMQEMSGFELRGTYVMCIFELNRNPEGLTITQLSQLCGEDKAAISRTISELVKRGLVTGNNDKKYRAPLVLTKEGQETAAKIDALASTAVAAGSNGLTPEEVKIFYKALTTISDNLNNYLVDTPDN
ncbi:MAG: MarR family transcriptional regulator [Lachnospiraceae bacterium]|nr:MarR family transcriptional regulator [Lachnospiraceae bacterium]